MRKFGALCALAAALCAVLLGCAREDSLASYVTADGRSLVDAGVCDGVMEEVDSFIISLLYGIDEESITDCVGFLALDTSVSADEITVLVLSDEEAARAAESACLARVESQIKSCTDYCPDQVPRLEKAVVLRRGNTVLLAVASPERLPAALEELGLG